MMASDAVIQSILVHIQSNLDGDLNLANLSQLAGLSPWHFHRRFVANVGETPGRYVTRVRLERAAFQVLVHDSTLLRIALDCGFRNPETFSRAFKRHFAVKPSQYRAQGAANDRQPRRAPSASVSSPLSQSQIRVRQLRPCYLAFIRHLGPYDEVPETLFDRLDSWADDRGLVGARVWMGIGHDAPATTAPHNLRYDAALVVSGAFPSTSTVACQSFPGGDHAIVTHVGPLSTLEQTYQALFPKIMALPGYRVIGLPVVEMYQLGRLNTSLAVSATDICIPVERI
jgi:AraC family transcriptional regulator